MTPLRGRSPRGQRLLGRAPFGHWKTSTFLAGLRHDRIVAPLVLDGAVNGESFRAYIEQFLAPTLQPGDVVIADNLGSHKVAGGASKGSTGLAGGKLAEGCARPSRRAAPA